MIFIPIMHQEEQEVFIRDTMIGNPQDWVESLFFFKVSVGSEKRVEVK